MVAHKNLPLREWPQFHKGLILLHYWCTLGMVSEEEKSHLLTSFPWANSFTLAIYQTLKMTMLSDWQSSRINHAFIRHLTFKLKTEFISLQVSGWGCLHVLILDYSFSYPGLRHWRGNGKIGLEEPETISSISKNEVLTPVSTSNMSSLWML